LHGYNFSVEGAFNKALNIIENLENFKLMKNKIKSNIFVEIIHKADIIILSSNISGGRTTNI
jgi:hypothetical protein